MVRKKTRLDNEIIKSEFQGDPGFYVLFATNGFQLGRMLAASKSTYCQEHQEDLVIFNANVITKSHGKIWYGDLNITLDFDNLKNIADKLNEDLYILMEGDARFGYENQSIDILIAKARAVIKTNKSREESKKATQNLLINKTLNKLKSNGTNSRSTK